MHLCVQAQVVERVMRMQRQFMACSRTPSRMQRPVHSGSIDARAYSAGHNTLTGPRGCIFKLCLTAIALLRTVLAIGQQHQYCGYAELSLFAVELLCPPLLWCIPEVCSYWHLLWVHVANAVPSDAVFPAQVLQSHEQAADTTVV